MALLFGSIVIFITYSISTGGFDLNEDTSPIYDYVLENAPHLNQADYETLETPTEVYNETNTNYHYPAEAEKSVNATQKGVLESKSNGLYWQGHVIKLLDI